MTEIYRREGVTVHCGDCLPILKGLGDNSFDTVITDPPYNNGTRYDSHDDKMGREEYAAWCWEWFLECRRVASRVIIFPGPWNLDVWLSREIKPGGIGCWYKPGTAEGHQSSTVFQFVEWEPFLVYGGKRMGGTNFIHAPVNRKYKELTGEHPCPKPLHLMMEVVKRIKGESILDPFSGSFTTGAAAILAGKKFIGIEKDSGYCKAGVFRLDRILSRKMEESNVP